MRKIVLCTLNALCILQISCQFVKDAEDQIVHYVSVHGSKGYSFEFKTRNGIERKETGIIDDNDQLEVGGKYAYISPDGQKRITDYQAGKNGFRPKNTVVPAGQTVLNKTNLILTKNATVVTSTTETISSLTTSSPSSNFTSTTINPTTTPVPTITSRFPEESSQSSGTSDLIGSSAIASLAGGGLG